jgi:hypothetical protein
MKIVMTEKYIAVENDNETEVFTLDDLMEVENACLTIKMKIFEDTKMTAKEKAQLLAVFCFFPTVLADFPIEDEDKRKMN